MANSSHFFADRIVNLTVTGSLVRIELGTVKGPIKKGEKRSFSPAETLVMPLAGFVTSFKMMKTLMDQLVKEGVVKQKSNQSQEVTH